MAPRTGIVARSNHLPSESCYMRTPKPPVTVLVPGLLVVLVPPDWPAGVVGARAGSNWRWRRRRGRLRGRLNWPKQLPDNDLPHDGGPRDRAPCSPRVPTRWVAQRSEIQLPPGAPAVDLPARCRGARTPAGGPTRARTTPTSSAGTTWCSPSIAMATPSRNGCSTIGCWRRRAGRDSARPTVRAQGAHQPLRSREARLDRR